MAAVMEKEDIVNMLEELVEKANQLLGLVEDGVYEEAQQQVTEIEQKLSEVHQFLDPKAKEN